MGRKSKYTPELVEVICDAIATKGGDEAGWVAGGISHETFYRWIKDKTEFSVAVASAREEFRKNCPQNLRRCTLDRLRDVIENGQIIRWKKTIRPGRCTRYKSKVSDETVWWIDVFEPTIEETEENRGIPQWAVDRVLPKPPPDIESAIALLEQHGYIVTLPTDKLRELIAQASPEVSEGDNRAPGLSEQDADEILNKILLPSGMAQAVEAGGGSNAAVSGGVDDRCDGGGSSPC